MLASRIQSQASLIQRQAEEIKKLKDQLERSEKVIAELRRRLAVLYQAQRSTSSRVRGMVKEDVRKLSAEQRVTAQEADGDNASGFERQKTPSPPSNPESHAPPHSLQPIKDPMAPMSSPHKAKHVIQEPPREAACQPLPTTRPTEAPRARPAAGGRQEPSTSPVKQELFSDEDELLPLRELSHAGMNASGSRSRAGLKSCPSEVGGSPSGSSGKKRPLSPQQERERRSSASTEVRSERAMEGQRSPGGRYAGERVYNEMVRARDRRQAMPGHACDCCGEFLAAVIDDEAERERVIQRCSRHRQFRRMYQTPPDFWEIEVRWGRPDLGHLWSAHVLYCYLSSRAVSGRVAQEWREASQLYLIGVGLRRWTM